MNRWNKEFDEHPIHTTINELNSYINTNFDDVDENEIIEKRRIIKILSTIEKLLSNIDPEIIPFSTLDSFNKQLRQPDCFTQLKNYNDNGNAQHLVNANNYFTKILAQFTQYMILSENFSVNSDIKPLESTLDSFTSAITSSKDNLADNIETIEKSVTDNEQRLTQLDKTIEQKKQETDSLISQWQQQFSDAQDRRNTDYNTWVEKLKNDTNTNIETHITDNKKILDDNNKTFSGSIDTYLNEAKDKHQAILDLYQLTAGDSVASAYIANADEEKGQANFWRWASVGFIIATAIWISVAFFLDTGIASDGKSILWPKLITSFSLTGVLLFGAAYSAQQSNRHRINEKKIRWFALEVKAIDPFIASLDDAMQKELKKQLSEKLFAQSIQADDSDKKIIDEHAYKTLVQGIVDILKVKS